ncbi:replication factor C / DNA polymerase IIIgamma-tau subunit [Striga asiatica]|uniref:Replication factor C / DNA polymerase IIIgamma-tau subunit n=1 Tax=Striga asiatica TaxID=4170 RepID=A0A5A7NXT6_STRAF|nr:replication factor C / DNA polymerase IIIgamma-tau subunit [Striga asiatica]
MSVEMGGVGGGRGGGMEVAAAAAGNIDPSNLHLKKELTQIRKAARVLRDPGTSSSWRSPLHSARSLTKHHYVHHHKSGHIDGNEIIPSSEHNVQSNPNNLASGAGALSSDKGNVGSKEREKKVFLYNWKSQKSESEKSKQICNDDEDDGDNNVDDVEVNSKDGGGSCSASLDVDSSSDARNNASHIFRCKNTDFTPSIMRTIKKKSRRISYSSSAVLRHHNEKLPKQILLDRHTKHALLRRDDLVSLVDQSDDAEDFCNSPLLSRFKNNGTRAHLATKILSKSHYRKEDDYSTQNPSLVESWDGTTGSFADDEVEDQLDLPGRQGCGISCYNWSRRSTPKSRAGYGSSCSPSFSDTLRRKGSSIFCGAQSMHQMRRRSNKRRSGQSLVPLLTNNGQRGSSSVGSDDELSMNLWELDFEALSRLDGRRWSSSCRSQEGLEIVAFNGDVQEESSPENIRSLSHKYRPMFFEELIGQNLVVQSLKNAISRKRVAPVYLFQGPRGTGKSSAARIFAAAINCLASEENNKPCGVCRECADFVTGKSTRLVEADGSTKMGIEKIKNLLKSLLVGRERALIPEFMVFVVDECHLLPSRMWLAFLRLLEKPLPHIVFVLVTNDVDNMPRAVLSRCQRHLFSKIGCGDIVARLRKIGDEENLDVDCDALDMIALNADGSLRDAETMLDQLSLFGKRISISLVNELIGVVSDEKLLELLELAMSSNATETVIRARELMDSGVDPIVLMSQMATLIVDIIAGTYHHDSFLGGRNLSERELERLKHALTLLSEAEKHLRVSSERSTWFTATLLQLGSFPSSDRTHSGSSRRQSSKATDEDHTSGGDELSVVYSQNEGEMRRTGLRCGNSKMLGNVWAQCIDKCHSKTLRQLLHSHARLVSISEVKGNGGKDFTKYVLNEFLMIMLLLPTAGGFVAHIGFLDKSIKARAEGFLSSITNSFEIVLRHNVEVQMILLPDSFSQKHTDTNKNTSSLSEIPETRQTRPVGPISEIPNTSTAKSEKFPGKRIESIIHEQRLETAWLQAVDRGTPRSAGARLRPERNQVLPQDGMNESGPLDRVEQWEDDLNREIKALKVNEGMVSPHKDQIVARRVEPSFLHNNSFTRDNILEMYNENIVVLRSPYELESFNIMISAWDTNLDQEEPVAVGCSAGTTVELKEAERCCKTRLSQEQHHCAGTKAVGFRGLEIHKSTLSIAFSPERGELGRTNEQQLAALMAKPLGPTGEFFRRRDAWRKHPMLTNQWRHATPGLGIAVVAFGIYLVGEAAYNKIYAAPKSHSQSTSSASH